MTDLSNFDPTGSEEHMAAQKAHVEEVAAREEARRAEAEANAKYPREFDAHTRTVDTHENWEGIATQYSFNTKAEALDAITAARNAGKHVVRQDEAGYIYEGAGGNDFRVNIED